MRLAENTGRKIVAKNRHLGTIAQLCQAISSQLRHMYVSMYLSGRGPAYSGPIRRGLFIAGPIVLTQEGSSLVNDVCECVRD